MRRKSLVLTTRAINTPDARAKAASFHISARQQPLDTGLKLFGVTYFRVKLGTSN
jgi:hypothetical protein